MPVGEEALRAHAVRIIPDDEIRQPHFTVLAHPAHQAEQVAATGLVLILQAAEQYEIARRQQHALDLAQPLAGPVDVMRKVVPVRDIDVVGRIADHELDRP